MDRYAATCPCSCHSRGMDAVCDAEFYGGCYYLHGEQVDTDDPHARRCARQSDCPGYQRVEVDDEKNPGETKVIRIGAPIQQDKGLCRVCCDVTATVIGKLEDDFWQLYGMLGIDQTATATNDLVGGSRELPIPIKPAVRDLAARIVTVATTWAEPVAESMGITWDAELVYNHTRPHAALAKAVGVLRYNVTRLIEHDPIDVRVWTVVDDLPYSTFTQADGVDAAVELCKLHDRAQSTLGLTDLIHRLPAPCPRCSTADVNVMALVRENGGHEVYCQRCNISYAEEDYKRLTLILADANPAAA